MLNNVYDIKYLINPKHFYQHYNIENNIYFFIFKKNLKIRADLQSCVNLCCTAK